jgi:hypothetical protein
MHRYDADDAYVDDGDTSGDDGNDHQSNDVNPREVSSGRRKIYQEKMIFLLQIRDECLPTAPRQYVVGKMERSSDTLFTVLVWQGLSMVLIKFHLHYHHQTEEYTLFPLTQASSLLNSWP